MSFHAGGTVVAEVVMSGSGGDPFGAAHTLHPVIKGPELFVEPAAAGGAVVELDGTGSHTHGDFYLVDQAWADVGSGAVISKQKVLQCFYPFGGYTVSHLITDNVQGSLAATKTITVAPDNKVPGAQPCNPYLLAALATTLYTCLITAFCAQQVIEAPGVRRHAVTVLQERDIADGTASHA